MAEVIEYTADEIIELDDFMSIAAGVDMGDTDQIWRLGEQLSMLGNNRNFLANYFARYIEDNFKTDHLAHRAAQTVILASRDNFYLRAAFWLPNAEMTTKESRSFAFELPHDHNFDLLSYSYCGSGYSTHVYEYDYDAVLGYIGEEVALKNPKHLHHAPGNVVLYRKNQDIHSQHAPETPSITLNVIPNVPSDAFKDQYLFDIDPICNVRAKIHGYAFTPIESRRHVFEMIADFAGDNLIGITYDFALTHPCRRTRVNALEALKRMNPSLHHVACQKLRDDTSGLVRFYCRGQLSELELASS